MNLEVNLESEFDNNELSIVATINQVLRIDANDGNTNIGFISATLSHQVFFIEALQIDPDYRRRGIARTLLNYMLRLLGDWDKPVYIKAAPYNDEPMNLEQLMKFYSSFGFEDLNDNGYMLLKR